MILKKRIYHHNPLPQLPNDVHNDMQGVTVQCLTGFLCINDVEVTRSNLGEVKLAGTKRQHVVRIQSFPSYRLVANQGYSTHSLQLFNHSWRERRIQTFPSRFLDLSRSLLLQRALEIKIYQTKK